MKYHTNMRFRNLLALYAVVSVLHMVKARDDDELRYAIKNGAETELNVRVVDDQGTAIRDAQIDAFFDSALNAKGEIKRYISDTNGFVIVSGRTGKAVSLRVAKNGYYGSTDEVCYVSMGQGVKNGEWCPKGLERNIVLNRIKNPKAIKTIVSNGKYTHVIGKWLGFDIEKYDFVIPNGNGSIADFEVKFEWDGLRGERFNGMNMDIRFKEPFSGAYYYERSMQSDFKDAYNASTNALYQKNFTFYSRPIRSSTGEIIARDRQLFDFTKTLVVRSRCVLDENAFLKSARYSEICDLSFGCGRKGAWIMFQPIFNPVPNDTNLEPKR